MHPNRACGSQRIWPMFLLLLLAVVIPLLCLFHLMSMTAQAPRGGYPAYPISYESRP